MPNKFKKTIARDTTIINYIFMRVIFQSVNSFTGYFDGYLMVSVFLFIAGLKKLSGRSSTKHSGIIYSNS